MGNVVKKYENNPQYKWILLDELLANFPYQIKTFMIN